jgi:hypothetical protein
MIKPGHAAKSRRVVVGIVVLATAFATLISQTAASGLALSGTASHGAAARLTSAQLDAAGSSRAVLAPDVVVVSAATVAANLVSVSSDGSIYVFKSSRGKLRQLKPGKVMLLKGYSVGLVSSVKKTKTKLTVTTTAASMTDIFKTADINYSRPVNFSKTFASLVTGTKDSAAASQGTAVSPDLTGAPAAGPPDPKVGLSFTGKGPGDFTYILGVTPSPKRLDWSIVGCVGGSLSPSKGSCTDKGTGLSLDATLSGYISRAKVSGEFDIANGRNVRSSYTFLSLGGVKFTYSGPEGVTESGGSDSAGPSSEKVKGTFITHKGSLTAESAAVEVATQMKVGIGPGLIVANVLGYADVIAALGQETGSDIAGLPCSKFYLDVSGHAYLEAQIASFKVSSPPQLLFDKKASDPRAEC